MADLVGTCYSAVFILIISFYLQNKLHGMEKHVPLPQWRMLRPVRKRFTTAHADYLGHWLCSAGQMRVSRFPQIQRVQPFPPESHTWEIAETVLQKEEMGHFTWWRYLVRQNYMFTLGIKNIQLPFPPPSSILLPRKFSQEHSLKQSIWANQFKYRIKRPGPFRPAPPDLWGLMLCLPPVLSEPASPKSHMVLLASIPLSSFLQFFPLLCTVKTLFPHVPVHVFFSWGLFPWSG